MLEPRRKSRTLSAELADTLIQRIRNQDYAPGTKLPKEMDIMEEFGVSRTVAVSYTHLTLPTICSV